MSLARILRRQPDLHDASHYHVLRRGKIVGRIYRDTPHGLQQVAWRWGVTDMENGVHAGDQAETIEQAMAAVRKAIEDGALRKLARDIGAEDGLALWDEAVNNARGRDER